MVIVNASRIPPRPLAGQRLESAGQQLEAWKPCCPALLALLPSCSAALLLCFLLCSAFRSALLSALCHVVCSAIRSALLSVCFQQLLSTLVSALFYALLLLLKIVQHSSIWDPKCVQNVSQIDPGGHLGGQEICSGGLWPLGRLLERSWTRMGPQKTNWNRLLDGPRPPRRSVSACLGAKWAPKRSPRRVPNRGPKAIRAENGKTLIFNDLCKDSNDFSGARGLFGGPKVGPKWGPNRIFDAEGLRIALGSLLERS